MNAPEIVVRELQDYQKWVTRNPGVDLYDYSTLAVRPDAFVAILEVLEPTLVKHEGAYFRARDFTIDAYNAWAAKLPTVAAIQRVMNHIHMSQFFREEDVSYVVREFIANEIVKHWDRAFASLGLTAVAYGDEADVEVTLFGSG